MKENESNQNVICPVENSRRGSRRDNWGRPIQIDDIDYKNGREPRSRFGTFHVWGYRRSGRNDGPPTMQTIAVVELPDGRVTVKTPDCITFLDRIIDGGSK